MGMLFKIILGAIIIIYLFRKVGGYFMRLFLGKQLQAFQDQQRNASGQYYKQRQAQREGEINVDFEPKNDKKTNQKSSSFDSGEYVDYEEVKD